MLGFIELVIIVLVGVCLIKLCRRGRTFGAFVALLGVFAGVLIFVALGFRATWQHDAHRVAQARQAHLELLTSHAQAWEDDDFHHQIDLSAPEVPQEPRVPKEPEDPAEAQVPQDTGSTKERSGFGKFIWAQMTQNDDFQDAIDDIKQAIEEVKAEMENEVNFSVDVGQSEEKDAVRTVAQTDETDKTDKTDRAETADLYSPPAEMPDWVDRLPHQDAGRYQKVLIVGPYDSESDAKRLLNAELRQALTEYQESYRKSAGFFGEFYDRIPFEISDKELAKCLIDTHDTVSPSAELPMKYALVEFGKDIQKKYQTHLNDCRSLKNTAGVGSWYVAILALLGSVFAYLRIDHLTVGKFRRLIAWGALGMLAIFGVLLSGLVSYLHGLL